MDASPTRALSTIRLDDLYQMTSHIYGERNAERPAAATFAHFVEVCGMLTIHTREKVREDISIEGALCKSLAWYFPLLAKLGVLSAEELIFRKYPYACPYCRECPHKSKICKEVMGAKTIDHEALRRKYHENAGRRPTTLDTWQEMFEEIYPRDPNDKAKGRSVVGLFEELGELAEAVRVFDQYPKYFVGEAADVFSYLMGIANEHALAERAAGRDFSLQRAYLRRYPGICTQCGYPRCICPAVPKATVGRMAKELELDSHSLLTSRPISSEKADAVSKAVWEALDGLPDIARDLPFDRGEANRSLVLLCLQTASDVASTRPNLADELRNAAVVVGREATYPGSKSHSEAIAGVVTSLQRVLPLLDSAASEVTDSAGPTPAAIRSLLERVSVKSCRIGIVTALPKEFAAVRAMFDESSEYTAKKNKGDPNDYVLGTIAARDGSGAHVVLATLAKKMGNNPASSAVSSLLQSFPHIKDVLMVGIAAGAPHPEKPDKHVCLGDLVISDNDGVIQYDNIKIEEHAVTIRDTSSKPSAMFVGRAQFLESERIAGKRPWESHIMRGVSLEKCERPPPESDTFQICVNGRSAPGKHPDVQDRPAPRVIYGRIGSANTLIKDPCIRDWLRDEANIRAFEMEGSGVADATWTFGQHYMIVRGVCDYGDMSKADLWQGYASLVAAAYCRALIESITIPR